MPDPIQRAASPTSPRPSTSVQQGEASGRASPPRSTNTPEDGLSALRIGSRSSASSSASPAAPRNLPPARANSPSAPVDTRPNPQETLNGALARAATYHRFMDRVSGKDATEAQWPMLARTGQQMWQNATRGLAADAELAPHFRHRVDVREAREALEVQRALGSAWYLAYRDEQAVTPAILSRPLLEDDADPETVQRYRDELVQQLDIYRAHVSLTGSMGAEAADGLKRGLIARNLAGVADFAAVCRQVFDSRRVMDLTTLRLYSYRGEMAPALAEALALHTNQTVENLQAYIASRGVLTHEPVDRQALPEALERMASVREQFVTSGERLCMAAAEAIDDGSEQWQVMLECADAVRALASSLGDLMQSATKRAQLEAAEAAAESSSTPAPPEQPSASSTAAAKPAAGRNRTRRRRPASAAPAAAAAAAPPPPEPRALAAKSARQALAKSRPLTREMAAQAGAVRIARDLRADTSTVDLMSKHQAPPTFVAETIRSSFTKWFGDEQQLRAARQSLAALPPADAAAPELRELAAQLDERIGALELMLQQLDVDEADGIKAWALPKEKDLERLLDFGQIAHVSAPRLLPSDGDTATEGTLFEMVITPQPLSTGEPAQPLFLHLHAKSLASPGDVPQLARNQFSSVHVKTNAQKNLGPKWEQIQKKLGYDDKVHRGVVGADMLTKLTKLAEGANA
jgi:hypothetical protein